MIASLFKKRNKLVDEPHEKVYALAISIVFFSLLYYYIHLNNPEHFGFNDSFPKEITYKHFLWYSTMINFTMPLGDVRPQSDLSRLLTVTQGVVFWTIMLF